MAFSLDACGNSSQNRAEDTPAENRTIVPDAEPEDNGADSAEQGVDTVAGASRVAVDGEVPGNNQYIAQIIQQQVGGDLLSIETVQEYPTTHEPLLEFAYEEKADNARPELATQIENLDSYDVIFLGFPKWLAYHNLIQCTQA